MGAILLPNQETNMQLIKTKRTTVTRTPKRASYDRQLLDEIITAAIIGHLSFYYDGSAHSIPLPFWCIEDYLYCHCSVNSRLVGLSENKNDVCISFAIVDGLVFAKSAFRHSMNYRSALVYGQFELADDDAEKINAMKQFMNLFDEKRWDMVRAPNKKEWNATAILKLPLKEAVVKCDRGRRLIKKWIRIEMFGRELYQDCIPMASLSNIKKSLIGGGMLNKWHLVAASVTLRQLAKN